MGSALDQRPWTVADTRSLTPRHRAPACTLVSLEGQADTFCGDEHVLKLMVVAAARPADVLKHVQWRPGACEFSQVKGTPQRRLRAVGKAAEAGTESQGSGTPLSSPLAPPAFSSRLLGGTPPQGLCAGAWLDCRKERRWGREQAQRGSGLGPRRWRWQGRGGVGSSLSAHRHSTPPTSPLSPPCEPLIRLLAGPGPRSLGEGAP